MIDAMLLHAVVPLAGDRCETFAGPLEATCIEFDIASPARAAAFLGQIAHESGSFRYVRELASGAAYEGRRDLGNTEPGDGARFKGRGLIQITGRANYARIQAELVIPCVDHPELLEESENAARVSGWFWHAHGLNVLADEETRDSFYTITRRINGGLNGLTERMAFWFRARKSLGLPEIQE